MKAGKLNGGGVVETFARHPNAANLLMVLLIIFGIVAIGRINTQFFPTVEREQVTVTVKWPGASAEDIEKNIVEIIEPEVRFIAGVDDMISYAREGSGTISLEFVAGTDMEQAVADVDTAVSTVTNLPEDSETPKVSKNPFFDRVARLAISGDVPEATLRLHAKKIRDDLISRGIDRISIVGMRDVEYRVEIQERELRRLGLSISDVSKAISQNSRDTPSGQLKSGVEKQIRALAEINSPQSLRKIEVRSFSSGEKVLLGDIADIRQDFEDGQTRGLVDGKPAIQLTVERPFSADTLKTAKILDNYLEEIKGGLPPGITLQKYEVRADSLIERISLLFWNGVTGLVLVVATLFIFLNARIAFWVAAGIPVAMFATLGIMLLLGQTINMITLFAMIMMLGVIVDDAIVVGEHTASLYEAGEEPMDAAVDGAGRMLTPVLAAMTTTIAAFAPMLLISGIIGQIMGVMPYVVISVIVASVIECFLILPGHLAHTLKVRPKRRWSFLRQIFFAAVVGGILVSISNRITPELAQSNGFGLFGALLDFREGSTVYVYLALITLFSLLVGSLFEGAFWLWKKYTSNQQREPKESWFRTAFDRNFTRFRDGPFNRLVVLSYNWRYVTIGLAIASVMILAIGPISGEIVKFVFFPSPESENIRARVVMNAGIPEDQALEIIGEVEASLNRAVAKYTDNRSDLVTAVFVTFGSAGRSVGDNLAEFRVQLASSEKREIRTPEIVKAWREELPKLAGTRRIAIYETRGGPPGRDIDIKLSGNNVRQLKAAATAIIPIVNTIDGVSGVSDDLPFGKPELIMELKPRGAALGFSIEEVGRQVRNAFDGAIPRRFAQGDDEITIRVLRESRDKGSNKLYNFELRSPGGEFVPLEEVVSLREKQGFAVILREDGKTVVSVTGDLNVDVITLDEALAALKASDMSNILNRMGVDYRYGGRNEERQEAFADLEIGTVAALAVIYIILAWVFGSYARPIAVMAIIPFGIVGAVVGHWVLGYKLTILSFIGLLGLAGILVNDSIILVSRLDERLKTGESLFEAATGASRDRLRAVLLTSLTTIGGLFPLMFEKSLQAQFLLPMAITIVFGLGLATILVLFLVPAFIGIGGDIGGLFKTLFGGQHKGDNKKAVPAE